MAYDTSSSCYYKLSLSNQNLEESLEANEKSSAANMSLVLDNDINLQTAIYMKSLAAECSIEDFTLTNLPNTFSQHETIKLHLEMDTGLSDGNSILTSTLVEKRNNNHCKIRMSDFITTSPEIAINHINHLLDNHVNFYILMRYAEFLCDTDFFYENVFTDARQNELTVADISLLKWYIEASLLIRLQLNANLNELLGSTKDITTNPSQEKVEKLLGTKETATINKSTLFQPMAERTTVVHRLMRFDLLYNQDLSDLATVLPLIATHITAYVTNQSFLERKNGTLTDKSRDSLLKIRDNNIATLQQAELIREILIIEQRKKESLSGTGLKSVYHNEMLALSIDPTGKCIFDVIPSLFLPTDHTQFTYIFEPITSRVLGMSSTKDDSLNIGPLKHDSKVPTGRVTLKRNNVTNINDRLYSRCRPYSKNLYILSDIIENDCHYLSMWLRNTKFSAYHVLASFTIDENDLRSGSIQKLSAQRNFLRIKQSRNILNRLNIALVDDDFSELSFMRQTYCHFTICVRPANLNL